MGTVVDTLVVHCISLPERGRDPALITDLFLNRLDCHAHASFGELIGLHVSSHFLIDRNGWFGVVKQKMRMPQLIGITMMIAGVVILGL